MRTNLMIRREALSAVDLFAEALDEEQRAYRALLLARFVAVAVALGSLTVALFALYLST